MLLKPREIARLGLRDCYPEDDFPTRKLARRARRAFKRQGRQRTRAEITAALTHDTDTKDS